MVRYGKTRPPPGFDPHFSVLGLSLSSVISANILPSIMVYGEKKKRIITAELNTNIKMEYE